MADSQDNAASAEKAYAEAAAEVKPARVPVASTAPAKPVAPVAKKPARKPATNTAFAKAAKPAARVARAAAAPAAVKTAEPQFTVIQLKEKIMATAKTADFTKPIADVVGELQTRTQAAYDKGTEVVTEATEFAKGNVEAIVESSKIFAAGAQTLGKSYVEEAKSAYETLTADVKELAAVKSPTELFQLQGKIMRRNFDMFVATSAKNSEAVMKLANDTAAPLTGRVEVATQKLAKVA